MRILSISGQNIASLAEPFLIDLASEPLRSAGLFAITGETGAGKSSILDAMCLALYGDAPRLSSGARQDEIPDAGGETIKAQDPRAILRKGAVSGWAAVTFMGIDGKAYEARWSARRSYLRADGRLQSVSRHVSRVSDGQILSSQPTLVTEQVQALTGLSYDEFRRTVLLAQGDFDAFLRADTNDRAALLEKVTGTGLYRAISSRVFDRTAGAQAALASLTLQLGAHHLMSDDAIADLHATRQTLLTAIDTAKADRLVLDADLSRHTSHALAQSRLTQSLHALTQAQTGRGSAAASRARLATIDRAEPLRLPFETARAAEAAQSKAAAACASAEAALAGASAKAQTQRALTDTATETLATVETRYKSLGPVWSKATGLDSDIKTARAEAQTASDAARSTFDAAQAAGARAKALCQRSEVIEADLTGAQTRRAALAHLAPLADRWDQVARDLAQHATANQTRHTAQIQSATLAAVAKDTAQAQASLESADAIDREARGRLAESATTLTNQIADLDATQPQDRLTGLTDLAAILTALDRAGLDHAAALARQAEATHHLTTETAARQTAHMAGIAAEQDLTRTTAATLALTAPAEQANLAASEAARQLRLRLVPGTPCPVCGATAHQTHAGDALTALAATLRADLARAQAAAQAASSALTQAKGQTATAEARAAQSLQTLTAEASRAETALTLWRAGLDTARNHPLCPPLPDMPLPDTLQPDAAKPDTTLPDTTLPDAPLPDMPLPGPHLHTQTLTRARNSTQAARQDALTALTSLAALRARKDTTERQLAALSQALDTRALQRQSLNRAQAQQAQDTALAQQTAASADLRCADLAAELAPHLACAGEPAAALTQNPNALRTRLHGQVQAHVAAVAAQTSLSQAFADLRPHLATTQAQAADTARLAEQARLAESARLHALQTLTQSRALLLDGEPTEAHRTRHNHARLAAQTAKAAADAALSLASSAESLTKGTSDSAALFLSHAATTVEEAHDRLLSALSATAIAADIAADIEPDTAADFATNFATGIATNFAPALPPAISAESLPGLFALPRAEVEALRLFLRGLEDAVTASLSAHAARKSDLTEIEAAGLPDRPAQDLTEALKTLDAIQATRQEHTGALNTQLATDAATRASLTGLQTRIDGATATLNIWAAVNDAIGSRNGDAFARIAQSITLDQLVDHANHHLADLKPRYRLRRAASQPGSQPGNLALQVEDLDMGAEPRATRSLSGGERFLVSLALALALSRMGDKGGLAATLFIDEGFGSLDATSLDLAIDALETLQSQGRMIGVISHVEAMKDRIPVQIRVHRQGGGKSVISIEGPK